MISAADLAARFDQVLANLLDATSASRTTFRLDDAARGFHVDDVAGEARREGVKSLRGQTAINQREMTTVKWLESERLPLIQSDLSNTEVPAPAPLIAVYGVTAQMLGPVVRHGELQGWVSVHWCGGVRDWSAADIAQLAGAVREIGELLDKAEPG